MLSRVKPAVGAVLISFAAMPHAAAQDAYSLSRAMCGAVGTMLVEEDDFFIEARQARLRDGLWEAADIGPDSFCMVRMRDSRHTLSCQIEQSTGSDAAAWNAAFNQAIRPCLQSGWEERTSQSEMSRSVFWTLDDGGSEFRIRSSVDVHGSDHYSAISLSFERY